MNDFGRINQTLQLIASNFYIQNTILEKKKYMITASSSFATSAKQIKAQDALDEITVLTLQKTQSALKGQQLLEKKNPQGETQLSDIFRHDCDILQNSVFMYLKAALYKNSIN